jgi:hypothetical protein
MHPSTARRSSGGRRGPVFWAAGFAFRAAGSVFLAAGSVFLSAGSVFLSAGFAFTAEARGIDFAHEVVPILRKHCGRCHTGAARQGGFSLDTRETALAGGESGKPGFVPGRTAESEILRRVLSADPDERMPAEGKPLPAEAVAVLRAWLDAGAPWEEGFSFAPAGWEPPLSLVAVTLPPARDGRTNPVDRIVDAWQEERGVPRPPRCDDRTFIRRASLDLVGLLPDPARVERFVADSSPAKRTELVAELLADDVARAEHWMTFWNDLLRNDYSGTGFITGGRRQITGWLHRSLVANKPFDRFVRELIAPDDESRGFADGIVWRGEVNSSQTVPIQFAQNVGQTFLGVNFKCASCHDSFVDRWTLAQTYELAAVYADKPLELHRCDKATGVKAEAAWPFAAIGQVDPKAPRRERLEQLARLVTDPRNGWLPRTLVNRLWHRLMGRGIVHPVDSLRSRPWSPELLDHLAGELVASGWDVRHVLATICTSEAYAAVTPAVEPRPAAGDYVFRGPLPRRLTAEQFTDAVWQLTGAAPAQADAEVVRFKEEPGAAVAAAPVAKWIWSNADAGSPPGEKLAFRRSFTLPSPPVHALLVASADNEVTVFVNGRKTVASTAWEQPVAELATAELRAGKNEIVAVAANAAAGGPAALRLELVARLADGGDMRLATDDSWEWSATPPGANGQYKKGAEPTDWRPAAVVTAQGTWAMADGPFARRLLAGTASGPLPMVRAVLVKATPLMAALGRPNRDQVVTSRPADLTTLEAIQLANEQGLFDVFMRGGGRILAAEGPDAGRITARIFAAALSRPPTEAEKAAAGDLLGATPTAETVADCLWAVVMLPEFQLVR